MPIIEHTTPDGRTMLVHSEQGFTFGDEAVKFIMPAKDLKLQYQWMKEMDVRDDDIMVCAFPKAGTHWLWEVMSMLSKAQSEYEKNPKEHAMLEFSTKEAIASIPSPRVLNTHHTPALLPDGFLDRKCKIIHVMRNPKDICVSSFYQVQGILKKLGKNVTIPFSQHVQNFMSDIPLGVPVVPCNYFWFIKEFEKFKADNPDYPVLDIYFEDMKAQPAAEIKKLAAFLNKDVSDELASEIAEKCRFENMKKANVEHKEHKPNSQLLGEDGKPSMYRKGQVGDWKNHFTVADNEIFDKWIAEQSNDTNIKFRYE